MQCTRHLIVERSARREAHRDGSLARSKPRRVAKSSIAEGATPAEDIDEGMRTSPRIAAGILE
jgi:hypothetical protein